LSGRNWAALLGAAALLAVVSSGCAAACRVTTDRACNRCYRFQETRTTKVLDVPVWRSTDDARETRWSNAFDRSLENKEDPHQHTWIPATETRVSFSLFGQRSEERSDSVIHYRTRYALEIVEACEDMDNSPGPPIYTAIVGDYTSRVEGKAERLSKLSKASAEAARTASPGDFWVEWWRENRASYEQRKRRRGVYETKVVTGEMKPLD